MSPASRPDDDDDMERIDEDPNAVTGDTRVRIETGDHGTYEIVREEYTLIAMLSSNERTADDPGTRRDVGLERYDWFPDERFTIHSGGQAEQIAGLLAKEGAFEPNVTFFRQMDYSEPDGADAYPDTCPTCGAGSSFTRPVWDDMKDYRFGDPPDYVTCTECKTLSPIHDDAEGDA